VTKRQGRQLRLSIIGQRVFAAMPICRKIYVHTSLPTSRDVGPIENRTLKARERKKVPERLLTPKEVAEWLRVSVSWVLDHALRRRRPYLPSFKLGKAVRFRTEDVEEFIEECARMKGVAA
jgi:excisionase family DNA binding protein